MRVTIVGGGASGVMHALYLRKHNKDIEVVILEKNDRILKKIMKTGNGRCNISNLDMLPKYYNNYEFVSKLYSEVKPEMVIDFFNDIGLLTKKDSSTRLYPYSRTVNTVIDTLLFELNNNNIIIKLEEEVIDIKKKTKF